MIKRKYLIIILIAVAVALMLVSSAQAPIGLPDYDSGWTSIGTGNTWFKHNLGTKDILVYVIGRMMEGAPENVRYYGTTDSDKGAYWRITNTTHILFYRGASDVDWIQVRVMVWKIEAEAGAVGGLYIPVDKFSLLAPYIALVSTIILAVSISVAYIKYRKKQ